MYPLPSKLVKPSIIVINLDKRYMPGSLWVAICVSDSGYAEYFDSYGLPPHKLEIMAYPQRNSISWIFKRHRLQGFTTNVCGYYCCIYALHRGRGLSMASFVNIFEPARHNCNDIVSAHVPRSVWSVPLASGWRSSSCRACPRYK